MRRKDKRKLFIIAVLVIALVAIAGMIRGAVLILKSSEFFEVKKIDFSSDVDIELTYLIGRNIFDINLKDEARVLRNKYPQLKILSISRHLPDKITLHIRRRRPVARIKSYRYFYIDEEGIILPEESDYDSDLLPLLVGLEEKVERPRYGWSYADLKEVYLALRLIKELKKNPATSALSIDRIDVSDIRNLFFSVRPYGVEIRIGNEDIPGRIKLLGVLLAQSDTKLGDLRYIDLRFSEPVVKPRWR